MSSRRSSNPEAFVSEILETPEKKSSVHHIVIYLASSNLQPRNGVLSVAEETFVYGSTMFTAVIQFPKGKMYYKT